MSALQYVGQYPVSSATVVPKTYADARNATEMVTPSFVASAVSTVAATLTTKAYVDAQHALRATQSSVTTANTNYVPLTHLGAASGVATLDSNGDLVSTQVPLSLLTDRTVQCYAASGAGLILSSGAWHTVTTTTVREYTLATIAIPDPGFPWRPFPFAWVQGNGSGGGTPTSRQSGTGSYGLLTVMPPEGVSDTIYGMGICTGSFYTDTYLVTPSAIQGQVPTDAPAITGGLTLNLSGCCFSGSSYTYFGQNLTYFCLVVPSL